MLRRNFLTCSNLVKSFPLYKTINYFHLYTYSKKSNKNIISSMEKINLDVEGLQKTLTELNIHDKNMPDIPKKETRNLT
jgi:hypothetical protein